MTREEELIKRMGCGEHSAMDELIALYYPDILRYCLWHAPNRSLAEDAVQETFLKVIRFFDSYTHKEKFKAFLYKIATNTCIDLRRKKWLSDVSLDELEEDFVYYEKGFETIQEDIHLRYIIRHLQPDVQEIVILRFSQDLTLREIAEITQLPLRTIQSRLRSALKQVKKNLEKGDAD
ncbi:MAG: RNA polymerase sigma factor [Oscillospiraceae bacterium]